MINLHIAQIERALPKVEKALPAYLWIQENFLTRDVSTDREFQRKFNGFYIIQRRKESWYKAYYQLFESVKHLEPPFENILNTLYNQTGILDASFSSKLIATINPKLPIIDKFVCENTGLILPSYGTNDRISKVVNVYSSLINLYQIYLSSKEGEYLVSKFEEMYPDAHITPIKMVDFVLWQTRPEKVIIIK